MYKYPRMKAVLQKESFEPVGFRMIGFGAESWKPTICMIKTYMVDWAKCFEIEAKLKAQMAVIACKAKALAATLPLSKRATPRPPPPPPPPR